MRCKLKYPFFLKSYKANLILKNDTFKVVPVSEADLPVILPTNISLTGRGGSPLKYVEDWLNVKCPK
jgi:leucyl-tRNA synthetase